VLCTTVVHSDMHTYEQFLQLNVGLGLQLSLKYFDFRRPIMASLCNSPGGPGATAALGLGHCELTVGRGVHAV